MSDARRDHMDQIELLLERARYARRLAAGITDEAWMALMLAIAFEHEAKAEAFQL